MSTVHRQEKTGEPWSVGSRRFSKYTFTFRHGPGVVANTVPADVQHLVLILNGRTNEKVGRSCTAPGAQVSE